MSKISVATELERRLSVPNAAVEHKNLAGSHTRAKHHKTVPIPYLHSSPSAQRTMQLSRRAAALTRHLSKPSVRTIFGDRKSLYRGHLPTNPLQKLAATAISAAKALRDPRRADMVGVLGEA